MSGRSIENLILAVAIGGAVAWVLVGFIEVLWKWRLPQTKEPPHCPTCECKHWSETK